MMDKKTHYTCCYCGFSNEKLKYIKLHIKKFHFGPSPKFEYKSEKKDVVIDVKNRATSLIELPLKNQCTFKMDLCPYCDFSDNDENNLKHHILTMHSKELDKIILHEEGSKAEETANRSNEEENNMSGDKAEPSFEMEKIDEPSSFAQLESSLSLTSVELGSQTNQFPSVMFPSMDSQPLDLTEPKYLDTKGINIYKCPLCDYFTAQSLELLYHVMQSHQPTTSNTNPNPTLSNHLFEISNKINEEPQVKIYSCGYCEYSTPRIQLLNRHMSKHTDRKPHKCQQCDYATKRLEHLNRHILSKHSDEKPYSCKYCDYKTSRDDHLKNHTQSKHNDEPVLHCDLCNYSAESLHGITQHIMTSHSEIKPFVCQLCKYTTTKEEYLTRHVMSRHLERKPYSCTSCEYSTARQEHLNRHILARHTEIKPYRCHLCSYSSSRSEHLNCHLLSHNKGERPHGCPQCDYKATRISHLNRHVLTKHTGIKPYYCSQCDYRAGRLEHLHRHVLSRHTNTKLLSCQKCNYTTKREDLLKQHLLTKHGEGMVVIKQEDLENELPALPKDESN